MAEIIGVAASATQLGVACFSLIDIIKRIKGGATTLKRYHQQLQDLQSISTCISQNPLLQTPEIGTQTAALLSIINNNCINSLLKKGRLLRSWGLLYKEQDLLETFVTLDRKKSTLSLTIEEIQSKALFQIQNDIHIMAARDSQNIAVTDTGSNIEADAVVSKKPFSKPFSKAFPSAAQKCENIRAINHCVEALAPQPPAVPLRSQSSHDSEGPSQDPNTRPPECH
ncbi:unnamed protein product [Fusarium langsethiae]|nr:unnamed protein product [Fusarium langsethiae]